MLFKQREAAEMHQFWCETGKVSRAEVVQYFQYARFCIEHMDAKKLFPTLMTFCSWMAHSKLDRREHYLPLRRATAVIGAEAISKNLASDIFNVFFDTYSLIREMNKFNNHFKCSYLEGTALVRFLFAISEELIGKPISCLSSSIASWDGASKALSIDRDYIVFSGRVSRNYSANARGEFCFELNLDIIDRMGKAVIMSVDYLRFLPDEGAIITLIDLDPHNNPMHHTHPLFGIVSK